MGLSSKQVSIDSLAWSQNLPPELPEPSTGKRQPPQNQQRSEPLKCPRCDSMNTKFCYYNNYNKSQPRHFCKSCKRHWTNGGTLRNVPVGGARKNKRLKMSKTVARDSPAATAADRMNTHMVIHANQQKQSLHLALGDQKNSKKSSPSSEEKCSSGLFFGSNLSFPLNQGIPIIPFSSSSSCDTDHSSMFSCFRSPHVYNYYSARETAQDSVVTTVVPTNAPITQHQSWQVANAMDTTSCWNWDDIDNFVSTSDLNVQWDVCELKP